jgi:protein tyrosine phosphatase (PTP) superfamily phosphohydrolase (DUF442 family)
MVRPQDPTRPSQSPSSWENCVASQPIRSLACVHIAGVAILMTLTGCGPPANQPPLSQKPNAPTTQLDTDENYRPTKIAAKHLPNAFRIHQKVISGGLPEGEAAFQELAALGVKTVISVDGATPDVRLARKHGMRYVHLPHGYDGVPQEKIEQLAKAVRDLPGPIYIHCHHGKHRSPTAAAVACVGAGLLPPSQSLAVLQTAGTSDGYKGLYESAREARRFETSLLDQLDANFPEKAELPPFAEAMVELEHTHDHLKRIAEAGWKTPASHPALEPAHEALLLREHFTEMLRSETAAGRSSDFLSSLRASELAAQELEKTIEAKNSSNAKQDWPQNAQRAFDRVSAECKACHTQHRDVPLSKKRQ